MAEAERSWWLTVAMPLLVAASWIFHGSLALDSDSEVSGRTILVWLSFVAGGTGLGTALAELGLRRAQRLGRTPGIFRPGSPQPTFFLMFGLFQVSMGVSPVSEGVTSVGDWAFLVFTSVAGGAFIGVAHRMQQTLVERLSAPAPEPSTTGS